ncbi:hypothetical protein B0H16DRAFT_1903623 [Mycena metata]|uniref:Uncharacterized protein n=1 Tax=Mycena metata TaxID=1033252 RepID=A0AAD7DRK5_9AGAR|nr:hypothetical protein B0H16DRAFT_1903623 [Mycena metata]
MADSDSSALSSTDAAAAYYQTVDSQLHSQLDSLVSLRAPRASSPVVETTPLDDALNTPLATLGAPSASAEYLTFPRPASPVPTEPTDSDDNGEEELEGCEQRASAALSDRATLLDPTYRFPQFHADVTPPARPQALRRRERAVSGTSPALRDARWHLRAPRSRACIHGTYARPALALAYTGPPPFSISCTRTPSGTHHCARNAASFALRSAPFSQAKTSRAKSFLVLRPACLRFAHRYPIGDLAQDFLTAGSLHVAALDLPPASSSTSLPAPTLTRRRTFALSLDAPAPRCAFPPFFPAPTIS